MWRLVVKGGDGKRTEYDADSGALEALRDLLPKARRDARGPTGTTPEKISEPANSAKAIETSQQGPQSSHGDAHNGRGSEQSYRRERRIGGEGAAIAGVLRGSDGVDGKIYWVDQAHVPFGQEARQSRRNRGVMQVIDRVAPTVPMLPVSASPKERRGSYCYPIPNDVIDFSDLVGLRSGRYTLRSKPYRYLLRKYQSVLKDKRDRGEKWGRLIEPVRPKVRDWLLGKGQL